MGEDLPAECTALSGALGELALGTLTGRERAALVAHLENCTACSAEVDAFR